MNYCHYFVWQIVLYTTNDNASIDALLITEMTTKPDQNRSPINKKMMFY